MFPKIQHVDELRAQVGHQPEIAFIKNEFGFTIVSYIISTGMTFTGENKAWARECRGITFDKKGFIHSRPLHKFFNIGELPETQMHMVPWDQMHRVMDKRDGSMVHPVRVHGKIYLKTKKSFTSDAANLATAWMEYALQKYVRFCHACLEEGFTPIFEFTSPKNRIVLPYAHDELCLLHVRDNVTGEYVKNLPEFVVGLGFKCEDINYGDEYDISKFGEKPLTASLEHDQDKEGYVIQFKDGSMMKGKTQWYLQLHRTIVFVRERDIAEMIINETVDDYKSGVTMGGGDLSKVEAIEARVLEEVRKIELAVEDAYSQIKDCPDRKTAAMKLKGHPWFGAAMNLYNGKEFDVKEYFLHHVLKQKFSLEQV